MTLKKVPPPPLNYLLCFLYTARISIVYKKKCTFNLNMNSVCIAQINFRQLKQKVYGEKNN